MKVGARPCLDLGMEGMLMQSQAAMMDKTVNVVLDIEHLVQSSDMSTGTGSPKMTKALSRKGSSRLERRNGEDQEIDETCKKFVVKVSQLEPLKQPLLPNKQSSLVATIPSSTCVTDNSDGKNRRFNRFVAIHPKKILLIFATLSSIGTLILIYFTLAINRTA